MNAQTEMVDLRAEDERWRQAVPAIGSVAEKAIEAARRRCLDADGMVDILLTSDDEMQRMNRAWRGKDRPTDVLSFQAPPPLPGQGRSLGGIALGFETCASDSKELDRAMDAHVSHLIVHGFLHLLGYDHEDPREAEVMESLEILILEELGYPDPYNHSGRRQTTACNK